MVQFSDIISTGPKKRNKEASSRKDSRGGKLWMSDSQIMDIGDLQGTPDPLSIAGHTGRAKEYYDALLEKAIEVRNRVKRTQGISPSPVISILHRAIEEDLIDAIYEYCASVISDDQPAESISITFGALRVGKGLGYDTERLIKLGLAAFLENVGMYQIPDQILQQERKLSREEMEMIRDHPEMSAQIVGRMGNAYKWLAEVVRQVHERYDGSGYPEGLKGKDISELASIIGIIDIYVAMTKDRPYRNKFLQTDAVKSVIGIEKDKFSPRVIKEFLNQISLFPVNACVRLNNKSIGRVVSTDKRQPMRPAIELLYDGLGRRMEKGTIVHLSDSPLLHIVGTVDEKELH